MTTYRECDAVAIKRQIGPMYYLLCGFMDAGLAIKEDDKVIGIRLRAKRYHFVEIRYTAADLYEVKSYRIPTRGAKRGQRVEMYHYDDIYAEQLGEIVLSALSHKKERIG